VLVPVSVSVPVWKGSVVKVDDDEVVIGKESDCRKGLSLSIPDRSLKAEGEIVPGGRVWSE
jgi:hypothetical protein